MSYAERTDVPIARTQSQIQAMIEKAGAKKYGTLTDGSRARIVFELQNRQIQFSLELPLEKGYRYTTGWEQACRSKWRALYLVIKAKLEAVNSGIAVFDEEFLAWIVVPGGETVYQKIMPEMQRAIESGARPQFLIGFDK